MSEFAVQLLSYNREINQHNQNCSVDSNCSKLEIAIQCKYYYKLTTLFNFMQLLNSIKSIVKL